jgi:hypothetical protein
MTAPLLTLEVLAQTQGSASKSKGEAGITHTMTERESFPNQPGFKGSLVAAALLKATLMHLVSRLSSVVWI